MKKFITLNLLALILLTLGNSSGYGQDTKSLLDKVITAIGGRIVLETIKDTTFSGTMDLPQMGMSATVNFYHKEPNMLRQNVELMGMAFSSVFDGKTGWRINTQTEAIEDLPEQVQEVIKSEALGFGNSGMLFPEKHGIIFTDIGKETIKGKEYLLLEIAFENGDTSLFYIDPGTFLPYKIISMVINQMGIEVEQESIMGDYKKIDGVNFAHSVIIYQNGEEFGSLIVDAVKFNSGLENSFFKK